MTKLNFHKAEILTFLLITILGIVNEKVTVFYIIYLFWLQELIRTSVDSVFVFRQKKIVAEKGFFLKMAFASYFVLWIYFIFIIILFGIMLNWGNIDLLGENIKVFMFKNWFFNINILVFAAEYLYFRSRADNSELEVFPFNRRHIILHVSIILGAVLQMIVTPRLDINNQWASALVIMPFMLLKIWIDKPKVS